ncbi:MAG TPA: OadG family transporter subunit [Arachnia sp.]|mgnify:CR=1 FL=1|nr:OadG family transporter subunit [Arachnia sp.]HMT84867.1 OadG family transporter subunit [Arachnia sp.]
MTTADLTWGLMMMGVGMGAVFALLLALMLVLRAIGRLDARPSRRSEAPPPPVTTEASGPDAAAPSVRILADGLTDDQVAAIAVAVLTHAEHRRRQAAPETRAHAPGSQLFASRWLAVGRARQFSPFRRR